MKKKIDLSKKFTVRQLLDVGRFFQAPVEDAYDFVQLCKKARVKPYELITDNARKDFFLIDILHEAVVCGKSMDWAYMRFAQFTSIIKDKNVTNYLKYLKCAFVTLQIQYAKLLLREGRAYHDDYDALETIDVTDFVFEEVSE